MDDVKYVLSLTPVQARLVVRAMDLFVRIGLGQLEAVASEIVDMEQSGIERPDGWYENIRDSIMLVKTHYLGHPRNGSYGVGNRNVPDRAHIVYDAVRVLMQSIAVQENHSSASVWRDGPFVKYGSEPLATCEIVVEKPLVDPRAPLPGQKELEF